MAGEKANDVRYTRLGGVMPEPVLEYGLINFDGRDRLSDHSMTKRLAEPLSVTGGSALSGAETPDLRDLIVGLERRAYVPIVVDGQCDGVLSLSTSWQDLGAERFEYFRSFGHLVELALGNAKAH